MSDSNDQLLRTLVTILSNRQPSSGAHSSSTGLSASNIVRSLRDDNHLADDVGHVLG